MQTQTSVNDPSKFIQSKVKKKSFCVKDVKNDFSYRMSRVISYTDEEFRNWFISRNAAVAKLRTRGCVYINFNFVNSFDSVNRRDASTASSAHFNFDNLLLVVITL